MPISSTRLPKYGHHRATGQGRVVLDGKTVYLGEYGTQRSKREYDRVIAEWLSRGRQPDSLGPSEAIEDTGGTVAELIAAYWQHVKRYYVKGGKSTSEQNTIKNALRPLRRLYGSTAVVDFSPKGLKAVRAEMIRLGWCRSHVNKQISRLKSLFRWGVENELVPFEVCNAVEKVKGLGKGRQDYHGAPDRGPITPVADQHVDATKTHVSRQVWAMIELQRLTAMRPGEVVIMRTGDIDTSGPIWTYRPESHKTEHHGKDREIYFGPNAQAVVRPFLKADLQAFMFSPAEAEVERLAGVHRRRKSSVQPSQIRRRERSRQRSAQGKRRRAPRDHFTVDTYRRAITRGCDKADAAIRTQHGQSVDANRLVPRWHPNQLRHTAATRIRKEHGIDAARVVLGHSSATMTGVYAELDKAKAEAIMRKIGYLKGWPPGSGSHPCRSG